MALIQSLVELKTCLCAHLRLFFTHILIYYRIPIFCVCFSVAIFMYIRAHRSNNFKPLSSLTKAIQHANYFRKLFSLFFLYYSHAEIRSLFDKLMLFCCITKFEWNNSFSLLKWLKLDDARAVMYINELILNNKQTTRNVCLCDNNKKRLHNIETYFRSAR